MMEMWQLKQMQSLPLEAKIEKTKLRIKEWYEHWNGNVHVSFSGGKDSTVLLDIVRSLYPDVVAVFVDTGLEYPEIREFVKTIDNVIWLRPKIPFTEVIKEYGYPVISKDVSEKIYQVRKNPEGCRKKYFDSESDYVKKYGKRYDMSKWNWLKNSDIPISSYCCNELKKKPVKAYEKDTGKHPMLGTMAEESQLRTIVYLKKGCNAFESKRPMSNPLGFWQESDIWEYLKTYNVPYSKIYDMGYKRTGCMFCMFGVHLEKGNNRFQRMKKTHPKQYEYCINDTYLAPKTVATIVNGELVTQETDEMVVHKGLGCGKVLDYIGVDYKTYQNELFDE